MKYKKHNKAKRKSFSNKDQRKKKGPTPIKIVRSRLLAQGFTLSDWAKNHGYNRQHVSVTLHRWLHRQHGNPRGKSLKILRSISRTTGVSIPVAPIEQ